MANVTCNNEECPNHEDGECTTDLDIEFFFHPSWPVSVSCPWDDMDEDERVNEVTVGV